MCPSFFWLNFLSISPQALALLDANRVVQVKSKPCGRVIYKVMKTSSPHMVSHLGPYYIQLLYIFISNTSQEDSQGFCFYILYSNMNVVLCHGVLKNIYVMKYIQWLCAGVKGEILVKTSIERWVLVGTITGRCTRGLVHMHGEQLLRLPILHHDMPPRRLHHRK